MINMFQSDREKKTDKLPGPIKLSKKQIENYARVNVQKKNFYLYSIWSLMVKIVDQKNIFYANIRKSGQQQNLVNFFFHISQTKIGFYLVFFPVFY